ncbi:MAG: hypothetical protein QXD23_03995, partial [Candidatus Micrarchaeaceae archaeon]
HEADKFDEWWDPKRFDWKHINSALCEYLPNRFDDWFDPKRFNWEHDSGSLLYFLLPRLDDWFDPFLYGWRLWKFELKHKALREYELYRYLSKVNLNELTSFIKDKLTL